jgi:hypothetical protein
MPCGCEGHADNESRCGFPALQADLAEARAALRARDVENEAKAAVIAALLKKAVFYLDRAKDFSADGQGDSLIRADLQRELFVIARGGK